MKNNTKKAAAFTGLLPCLLVGLFLSATAMADDRTDSAAQVDTLMAGLEWGMKPPEVFALIESQLRDQVRAALADTKHDVVAQDRLLAELRDRVAEVKAGFVVFDGRVSGWDVSALGPEFRRGTAEAMLVYDDERSRNHYFFIRGRLWKWYREFKPDAFGGADFDGLAPALRARFGSAEVEAGKRLEGSPLERWMTWRLQAATLVVVDRGRQLAFVLSDDKVQKRLASLRRGALPRGKRTNTVVDTVFMSAEERERFRYGEASAER